MVFGVAFRLLGKAVSAGRENVIHLIRQEWYGTPRLHGSEGATLNAFGDHYDTRGLTQNGESTQQCC